MKDDWEETIVAGIVLWTIFAIGIGVYLGNQRELTQPELIAKLDEVSKQRIAVQVLCGPGSHWKGMQAYCGNLPADGFYNGE